jgi:WD40 repeat protein
MQRIVAAGGFKVVVLGGLIVLAVWLALGRRPQEEGQMTLDSATVPEQQGTGMEEPLQPQPTRQLPLPTATSTRLRRTATPTHAQLQPAVLVTPQMVSEAKVNSIALGPPQRTMNSEEAIHSMAWAPTGDKFVYATNLGKLYWSDIDGGNATLIHQYEPDTIWLMLEDQQPKSNTLFLTHAGPDQGMVRGPGHIDVLRFSPKQPPILEEVSDAGVPFQIRWWRSDRASGIRAGGYVGGDKLITLDQNGRVVEERNIPYMQTGAVSPGGHWLAYATSQQTTNTQFVGSDPETVYLLDLATGERTQITSLSRGNYSNLGVHSWSPDGGWLLIATTVNGALRGVLVRPDGSEWVVVTPPGYSGFDAAWSPDSRHLAFSVQGGGQEEPNQPAVPRTSQVYVVDIAARELLRVHEERDPGEPLSRLMMHPIWSPDGSQLALLSLDPDCIPVCSGLTPSAYVMSFDR